MKPQKIPQSQNNTAGGGGGTDDDNVEGFPLQILRYIRDP